MTSLSLLIQVIVEAKVEHQFKFRLYDYLIKLLSSKFTFKFTIHNNNINILIEFPHSKKATFLSDVLEIPKHLCPLIILAFPRE